MQIHVVASRLSDGQEQNKFTHVSQVALLWISSGSLISPTDDT